ncbi:Rha family transcriptional regulator [[Curtobacterium] plantarum]|uniref:Rha family transcriptional regulator n=1 Tax=[Curtobacterium] plantarum TaxID=221276 RepID=UPI000F098894|nr:Rha family transcriptional regulator [[Curtobacterium] plantarum]RNA78730.1 Rha family transcriptional regulator [[Curtobacterium] plantarum]
MSTSIELNNVVSMTTLEIAELTGKRHDNVMRDCQKLLEVNALKNEVVEILYNDAKGESRKAYQLTKKATFVLVSGYSAELRLKCFERIEFLESQVQRLEDDKKRVAVQSANRRGVTWGDFCKAHDLPAQRLLKALKKSGGLFRFRPDGRVEVNPRYRDYFIILKPTDRRFSPTGINFRFNAKGQEYFSNDKALDKFRSDLVEQLGSDYEKQQLILSRVRAGLVDSLDDPEGEAVPA